jgi:ABC-type nitrate/sulfonate/bicarbonate transport system ATPase subunit
MTLGLEVQGMSRREARTRVEPLIAEFGLSGFERHYPSALSGGMRQRAALLRTVVQERPMLLLDEPFGALDALTRNRMQLWLEDMWLKHRWTAMLVTHEIREAVMLSDRIYVLSPRPARVAQVIDVQLPRPRLHDAGLRAEAAAIESTILDILFSPQFSSSSEGQNL